MSRDRDKIQMPCGSDEYSVHVDLLAIMSFMALRLLALSADGTGFCLRAF